MRQKKRPVFLILVLLVILALMARCEGEDPGKAIAEKTGSTLVAIGIDKTSVQMREGETTTLRATLYPDNLNYQITWISDNPEVLTVNDAGELNALAAGFAIVTASAGDKSVRASVNILSPEGIPVVRRLSINAPGTFVVAGNTLELQLIVAPYEASDRPVSWSSNYPHIATVDDQGVVTGVAMLGGVARITASADDQSTTVKIVVRAAAKSITIDRSILPVFLNAQAGQSVDLRYGIEPSLADQGSVTWTSEYPEVATVRNGKVTAVSRGVTTITVRANNSPQGEEVIDSIDISVN